MNFSLTLASSKILFKVDESLNKGSDKVYKIVDKIDNNYMVLDTSDGVVEPVSEQELVLLRSSGTYVDGCYYSRGKLYTVIDGSYHNKPMKSNQKFSFVLDSRGVALSPTKEEKAWYLIRKGRAKLLRQYPMVIQLQKEQDNTDFSYFKIGIDPGDTTGIAIVQESHLNMSSNKTVFKAEILHRKDVSKKMTVRAEYRRARRSEKRYRKARFDNRAASRRRDRVAPSIKCRKDEIIRVLNLLLKYIDVSGIYCEDVAFDIRALVDWYKPYNWQYQQSNRLDENIRKAVIMRDKCKCMMCRASGVVLEVHHITPRREDGINTISNLITLCSHCHEKVTGNEADYKDYFYSLICGRNVSLKPAMHVMQGKTYLYGKFKELVDMNCMYLCTGGDTANLRLDWGIEKTHTNDAACITDVRCLPDNLRTYVYKIKPQRKKIKTTQDTSALAIKHRDMVWYKPRRREQIKCYVTAIIETGSCVGKYKLKSLDGESFGPIDIKSLKLISKERGSLLFA